MKHVTDPRLIVLLPSTGLGAEADCWERLHQAYSRWMAHTHTYTPASVGVLYALSVRTWDAHSRDEGRA